MKKLFIALTILLFAVGVDAFGPPCGGGWPNVLPNPLNLENVKINGSLTASHSQWNYMQASDMIDIISDPTKCSLMLPMITTSGTNVTGVDACKWSVDSDVSYTNITQGTQNMSYYGIFAGDGSQSEIIIADDAAFEFGTGNFTAGAWVYTNTNSNSRRIIGKFDASNFQFILDSQTGYLRFRIYDSAGTPATAQVRNTDAAISTDSWIFVVVVLDYTSGGTYYNANCIDDADYTDSEYCMAIYEDGVETTTDGGRGATANFTGIQDQNYPVTIGTSINAVGWDGRISMPFILKGEALSPAQIYQMYQATRGYYGQ